MAQLLYFRITAWAMARLLYFRITAWVMARLLYFRITAWAMARLLYLEYPPEPWQAESTDIQHRTCRAVYVRLSTSALRFSYGFCGVASAECWSTHNLLNCVAVLWSDCRVWFRLFLETVKHEYKYTQPSVLRLFALTPLTNKQNFLIYVLSFSV
jgi:hypothetical protein